MRRAPTSKPPDVLFRLDGKKLFDCVLSAELAELYKPKAEVYLMGVRLLGLEPGQVMMVAAHPFDLKGARRAGLRTAFVDRPLEYGPDSPPREDPEADISLEDLDELTAQVRAISRRG